jgi:hypothetical protein
VRLDNVFTVYLSQAAKSNAGTHNYMIFRGFWSRQS